MFGRWECISYYSKENGDLHIDLIISFLTKYHLYHNISDISVSYICKYLASLSVISFINLGLINGKRGAIIYLPESMTKKQIEFLEDQRELFNEKFYDNDSLFRTYVYTEEKIDYKAPIGIRDLKVENIIYSKNLNGYLELFEEVEKQKSNLRRL